MRRLHLAPLPLLFASLFACGGDAPSDAPGTRASGGAPSGFDSAAAAKLYAGKGTCAACHGKRGEGNSMLGPALTGSAEHWDQARLTAFLGNPGAALGEDARLAEMAARYPSPMPAATSLDEQERALVAAFVLTL